MKQKLFSEIKVSDEIRKLVEDLIEKIDFKSTIIKYYNGSQIGDGYGSETIAVEVRNDHNSLNLFLKCTKNVKDTGKVETDKIYANEIYFYNTIYPSYMRFLREKGVEDGFRNAPKYYGAKSDRYNEVIILENLRSTGYTLFNRSKFMDDQHLSLVLKTFAKFHAISFAIKDQNPQLHEEICKNCYDVSISMDAMGFYKVLKDMATDFFGKLDPDADKDILDKCDGLIDKIIQSVKDSPRYKSDYTIFTKGDCWSNNMMVLYEDELEEIPQDLMLIDWQLIRKASPIHDIMNLFFSVISEEALDNCDRYRTIYYEELSRQIRQMGSDPGKLYPRRVFEDDWRKLSLYGYGVSILLVKMMLSEVEEAPNFEGMNNGEEFKKVEEFIPNIKKEDEYMRRMRYITRYLIKSNVF